MNLPPDKLKLLSQYDNDKKWELVCDQVRQFFFFRDTEVVSQINLNMHVIKSNRPLVPVPSPVQSRHKDVCTEQSAM